MTAAAVLDATAPAPLQAGAPDPPRIAHLLVEDTLLSCVSNGFAVRQGHDATARVFTVTGRGWEPPHDGGPARVHVCDGGVGLPGSPLSPFTTIPIPADRHLAWEWDPAASEWLVTWPLPVNYGGEVAELVPWTVTYRITPPGGAS